MVVIHLCVKFSVFAVSMATYYGGYSYKVDHNMAPKPWISIPNIKIYLETKFRSNRRIFIFWWSFWIQNGHHSKPTMDINSQHHNLLGNQISPKSEDFCILAAILDSKWQPQQTNDEYQIRNIIIYLDTKFRPNREDFCIWRPFCTLQCFH